MVFSGTGGGQGDFRVVELRAVTGEGLPAAAAIARTEANAPPLPAANASWSLRGATGHLRYVERQEKATLAAVTPPLGRVTATCAALIPIRKSDAWWELTQDDRRAILADQSQHISVGLRYLPTVARKLYHCRELGEPFDFLTWFEFAPEAAPRFDELLAALRESAEWRYVDREVELRLERVPGR